MSRPMTVRRPSSARAPVLALLALAIAACSGPVLANPPAEHPVSTPSPAATARPVDPQPIVLPRDDAPHDRLTEWWYYTGHLRDSTGGRWGFEYVIFRAERGDFPVSWASHLALTDETGGRFHYAQRAEIGPQVDMRATPGDEEAIGGPALALGIRGLDASDPTTFTRAPWLMTGLDGADSLAATATAAEAQGDPLDGFGLKLALGAAKPPALHDGDGYVDFGPAGGSYYYSRTAMTATGTVTVGERDLAVDGIAWFDHQWGDFIAVGAGGWDWFAVNLDDGTDITLSLVRAADGTYPLVYGTLVDAAGAARNLGADDFTVAVEAEWTIPVTGATYPAGWTVTLPGDGLVVELRPTVPQQELDTRTTTGVVYWEGSQRVAATRARIALGGRGYVELTGYASGT